MVTLTAAALILALGALAAPPNARTGHALTWTLEAAQEGVPVAAPQRIEMTVLGLSCPFCAYGLEKKLRKVEGLRDLRIELGSGRVALEVVDGSAVPDERIRGLVEEAGFEVAGAIERSRVSDSA